MPRRAVELLMVEDNPGDVLLVREAFADVEHEVVLHAIDDGEQAIEHLARCAAGGARRPDLVLLDLNLPRCNGCEVLAFIRSRAALADLPVVVLSSSRAERDITECYRLRANCYVTKPSDFDEYLELVQVIQRVWMGAPAAARTAAGPRTRP